MEIMVCTHDLGAELTHYFPQKKVIYYDIPNDREQVLDSKAEQVIFFSTPLDVRTIRDIEMYHDVVFQTLPPPHGP